MEKKAVLTRGTTTIISLTFICSLLLIVGCTEQPYYAVPTDASGKVVITGVSKATSSGITTLDDAFTVDATLPNAKEGDVMKVELLQLQVPPQGGNEQLLPMAGTQKEVTVGSDLKVSVTYSRAEAQMNAAGDYVVVTFAGKTDAADLRVDMAQATSVSNPQYEGNDVEVIRTAGTAFFDVNVQPVSGDYTGTVTVKKKNGAHDSWVEVGSFPVPASVPISGDDFAPGKDTLYYSFVAPQGALSDEVTTRVIVSDPYFFLKRTGILSLVNPAQGGMDILTGSAVAAEDGNAILSVNGDSLTINSGSAWAVNGKSISFVPATLAMYDLNNVQDAITVYEAGTPTAVADPIKGEGVFIFKIINGPNPSDVFYGLLKVTEITPGASVDYEYRIGNLYAHLPVIQ